MKILLVNKYYYLKGGDCTYFLELEKLLLQKGHSVAVFAMSHPNNYPSKFENYFPSEVDFNKPGISNLIKNVSRPFYSKEVKYKFEKLLSDFNPDVIHLNNIHSQLSPFIAKLAYKKKIPIIWTQHDYKVLCPAYISTRNFKPCELCYDNKVNVIKHKCIKGSLAASSLAYLEAKTWNKKILQRFTFKFIAPSKFIEKKLIQGGFEQSKVINLPYFINLKSKPQINNERKNFYCYVGRLVKEKGLETFLDVAIGFPNTDFIIIGTGPMEAFLKSKYKYKHIIFKGYQKWNEIELILKEALFSVVPSEWYENYPLSIIESLAIGTPVLGSDSGGIPEMIQDGFNGKIFRTRDKSDLKEKLQYMLDSSLFNYKLISENALAKYSIEIHYQNLLSVYKESIKSIVS